MYYKTLPKIYPSNKVTIILSLENKSPSRQTVLAREKSVIFREIKAKIMTADFLYSFGGDSMPNIDRQTTSISAHGFGGVWSLIASVFAVSGCFSVLPSRFEDLPPQCN